MNVSTGSLVSSLQPAPAEGDSYSCQQPVTGRTPAETEHSSSEVVGDSYSCQQPVTDRTPAETEHSSSEVVGDGYSCQQPVTDRTPAETEHSSSEVVLHRTVLQTLWRALCSRNSCSLIVCEADAKPVRAATLSSQIYISNQY